MKEKLALAAPVPLGAACVGLSASQENHRPQDNAALPEVTAAHQEVGNLASFEGMAGLEVQRPLRESYRECPKKAFSKAKSRNKPVVSSGSGSFSGGAGSKLLSPEEVLEMARTVKDKLPEVPKKLLEDLKARGLEPCTLQDVLDERGLQWAATQVRCFVP